MSVEEIRNRMLDRVPDEYSKSTGSFFYDPIAAVAIEMNSIYGKQDEILKQAFASSASGEYLEKRCKELGVERKKAVASSGIVTVKGEQGAKIAKGDAFSSELVIFKAIEDGNIGESGSLDIAITCAEKGRVGNIAAHMIKHFPITLPGIREVTNETAITNGYDEESDESLYRRYYEKVTMPATSGNAAHYKMWAESVNGIGKAKVFPLHEGPGTVKVLIVNSNNRKADAELINNVKEHINVERPIGAEITVNSASEKSVLISAKITLASGNEIEKIKLEFQKALEEYFAGIALIGDYISYAKIGAMLYGLDGVVDYKELKINGSGNNIVLGSQEIPVVGEVILKNA